MTTAPGATVNTAGVRATLAAKLARWQLPDDVIVIDELPLTATGKIDKKVLRERFRDHLIERTAAAGESAPLQGSAENR